MRPVQCAHWHRFFENISISPQDFYKNFDTEIAVRKVPGITAARVEKLEGGPLSAKRIYLELQRDWMTYHICAAPFGTGFFVSSRLIFWPWRKWPILAGIGGVLFFALFILFCVLAGTIGSAAVALLTTAILAMPTTAIFVLIGAIWFILCLRLTYYRQDTMLAFHEAVHGILVAQVNRAIEAGGQKALTEIESKPILHKLLER